MVNERFEVETLLDHDRRHASAAIRVRNAYTIGRRVNDTWAVPDCIIHFAGCNVLALPAESVADTVDEIEISLFVDPHQIAGSKPSVALRKHVTQDLLLGLGGVRVALKLTAAPIRFAYSPDRLTGFADAAGC